MHTAIEIVPTLLFFLCTLSSVKIKMIIMSHFAILLIACYLCCVSFVYYADGQQISKNEKNFDSEITARYKRVAPSVRAFWGVAANSTDSDAGLAYFLKKAGKPVPSPATPKVNEVDYYNKHLGKNSSNKFELCSASQPIPRVKRQNNINDIFPEEVTLDQVINERYRLADAPHNQDIYRHFLRIPTTYSQGNAIENAVVQVVPDGNGGEVFLPSVITADIRSMHLEQRRPGMNSAIDAHMTAADRVNGDHRGHLLAHSLGGPTVDYNIVPQAAGVNTHRGGFSAWYFTEEYIRRFLYGFPRGHVNWRLAVMYEPLLDTYRPQGFCLQYTCYYENGTVHTHSDEYCFANHPNRPCDYIRRPRNN